MRTYRGRRLADRELVVLVACCVGLVVVLVVGLALYGPLPAGGRLQGHRVHCQRQSDRLWRELDGVASAGRRHREGLRRARLAQLLRDLERADPSCAH